MVLSDRTTRGDNVRSPEDGDDGARQEAGDVCREVSQEPGGELPVCMVLDEQAWSRLLPMLASIYLVGERDGAVDAAVSA